MRHAAAILLVLSLPLAEGALAAGPTFVVNRTEDAPDAIVGDGKCETAPGNGFCTLHAAIQEANAVTDAVIQLPATSPADPILLNGDAVPVSKSVTIQGAGKGATVVSGKTTGAVFVVTVPSGATATLRAMTITDGNVNLPSSTGSGVLDDSCGAFLTIEDVLVSNCTGAFGGGVRARAALSMTRTEIRSCHAVLVFDFPKGGGVYVGSLCAATHVLRDCTIDGNASGHDGGGLYVAGGEVHLVNTTVSGNSAANQGGGIYVAGGQLYLENATVAGNTANTLAGGGGLYNASAAAPANFTNTILADNREPNGQLLVEGNCNGLLTSGGYNVYGVDDQNHCSIQGGSVTIAGPLLGPLKDNGGSTPTRALYGGSPAVDTGDPLGCKSQLVTLTADQRGVKRPFGTRCDIGAYERAPCGDVNGDGAVNVIDVFFLINHLFAGGAIPPGLANVNQDSVIDVNDVFYLINALFSGGPAPVCPWT
jgi:predicted outer membrane repeat protein